MDNTEELNYYQGRNEVRWRPDQEASFTPMFRSEVFRKQMCCIEVLVTLLGLFGDPEVIRRPRND